MLIEALTANDKSIPENPRLLASASLQSKTRYGITILTRSTHNSTTFTSILYESHLELPRYRSYIDILATDRYATNPITQPSSRIFTSNLDEPVRDPLNAIARSSQYPVMRTSIR